MPKVNFWAKCVPRIEIDHRARELRLRLDRAEQLLVGREDVAGPQPRWLFRVLGFGRLGGGRTGIRSKGSMITQRLCEMFASYPFWPAPAAACLV